MKRVKPMEVLNKKIRNDIDSIYDSLNEATIIGQATMMVGLMLQIKEMTMEVYVSKEINISIISFILSSFIS